VPQKEIQEMQALGGIIRNSEGELLLIYLGSIGWDTNNSVELEGLMQGLSLDHDNNFFPLEVEAYSQVIINIAHHLLQGSRASNLSKSWRLITHFEILE